MAGFFFQFPNMFGNMQGAMNMLQGNNRQGMSNFQGVPNFQGASNFQGTSNFQRASNFQRPANAVGGSNFMNVLFRQGAIDSKKKMITQTPIRSPNEHFYPQFMLKEARNELNDLVWCDGSMVWNGIRRKTGIDFLNNSSVEEGWGKTSCEYSHANLEDSILCHTVPPEIEQVLNSPASDSLYVDSGPSSPGTSGQSSPSTSPASHPSNTGGSTNDHSNPSKGRNSTADTETHSNSKNINSVRTETKIDCKNSESIKTETVRDIKKDNSVQSSRKRSHSGENKTVQNDRAGPQVKRLHLSNDHSSTNPLPWGAPAVPRNSPSVQYIKIPGAHAQIVPSTGDKHSVISTRDRLSLGEQDSGYFTPTSPIYHQNRFSSPGLISTSTPYGYYLK